MEKHGLKATSDSKVIDSTKVAEPPRVETKSAEKMARKIVFKHPVMMKFAPKNKQSRVKDKSALATIGEKIDDFVLLERSDVDRTDEGKKHLKDDFLVRQTVESTTKDSEQNQVSCRIYHWYEQQFANGHDDSR